MDTNDQLITYGIDCSECGAVVRLGKVHVPIDAQPLDSLKIVRARYGLVNHDTCLECNSAVQFSADQIRPVDDSEYPPELAVNPA